MAVSGEATIKELRERAEKARLMELLPTAKTRRELADRVGVSVRTIRYKLRKYGLSDALATDQRQRPWRPVARVRPAGADRRAVIREFVELHARTLEAAARAEQRALREAMRHAAHWQNLADRYPDDRLLIHASLREVA